jgi:hypothetical protein
MKLTTKTVLGLCMGLLLAACGGGSGESNPAPQGDGIARALGLSADRPASQVLWVAPNGVDAAGGGDKTAPLRTLAYACTLATAGQMVRLTAGEFQEVAPCVLRSGVRVAGSGISGTQATVVHAPLSWDFRADGVRDDPAGYIFRLEGVQGVGIERLVLNGNTHRANGAVLVSNASGVALLELDIRNFRLYGLQVRQAAGVVAQRLVIENSSFEWFRNEIAEFPAGGSLGNLGVFDTQDSVFASTRIKTTGRHGYGIKASNLRRVRFSNIETDLYPYQSWNAEGTPNGGNFSMELHGGYAESVEISHSLFDATLSLLGGSDARYDAVPYSLHVHHNRFDPKLGTYGIELGTDKMVVDHNSFTGTWTAMQNFGDSSTRIRNLTVFNNVADVWMRFIGLAGEIENLRVFGNSVVLGAYAGQNYLVTLNANNNSRNWLIANNAVVGSTTNPPNTRHMVLSYVESGQGNSVPKGVQLLNNVVRDMQLGVALNEVPVDLAAWDGLASANVQGDPGLVTTGSEAFMPAADSLLIDRGLAAAGLRSGYVGAGRDVGAFERGQPAWRAGPRTFSQVRYLWAPTTTVRQPAFVESIDVPLSAGPGEEIRYTLDGTEPGPDATLYTAPIRVDQPVKLRARSFKHGFGSATALSLDLTKGAQGYLNLAAGRPATASSVYPDTDAQGYLYAPAKAFDGITFSWIGWTPAIGDALPWLQVDLGVPSRIRYLELFTRAQIGDDPSARRNFEVQASNDPGFATYTVLAAQGSDALPFQGVFVAEVADPARYRYVRAVKTVAEGFFVTELIVRGE